VYSYKIEQIPSKNSANYQQNYKTIFSWKTEPKYLKLENTHTYLISWYLISDSNPIKELKMTETIFEIAAYNRPL